MCIRGTKLAQTHVTKQKKIAKNIWQIPIAISRLLPQIENERETKSIFVFPPRTILKPGVSASVCSRAQARRTPLEQKKSQNVSEAKEILDFLKSCVRVWSPAKKETGGYLNAEDISWRLWDPGVKGETWRAIQLFLVSNLKVQEKQDNNKNKRLRNKSTPSNCQAKCGISFHELSLAHSSRRISLLSIHTKNCFWLNTFHPGFFMHSWHNRPDLETNLRHITQRYSGQL